MAALERTATAAPTDDGEPAPGAARRLGAIGAAAVLLGVGVAVGLIVVGNDGVFSYTLDDPYVHLELARNLSLGHHGVEPGQFSAPSSSILWPLLLVPAWWAGMPFYAPLVLNLLAGLLAVAGSGAALARALGPVADTRRGSAALLALALVLIANVVALVPTGMEHTLQVALTAWFAVGLIDVDRGLKPAAWLAPIAIVLPLLRLEDAGIVLLGAAWLAWRGWRGTGAAIVAGVVGTVAPYLVWLHGRSGFWLPFSILSKRDMFRAAIVEAYDPSVAIPLLLAGALVVRSRRRDTSTKLLALIALAGCVGHDLFSQIGLFHRYVAYITLFVVLLGAWIERGAIRAALQVGGSTGRVVLWIAALVAITNAKLTVDQVGAGEHIWRLHGQLRRIATEVVDGPVAVNDIGWVSYDNDRFVVDLVGLASIDALRHRLAKDPPDWMAELAAAHDAKIVMVYEHWFDGLPGRWVKVGTLVVDRSPFAAADRQVALLAPDAASAPALREKLDAFAKKLPEGVRIVFER